jgi:hypothetical protein
MRRLTLILSDLYLPDETAAGVVPQIDPMPELEWLLRFAEAPARIGDWRRWLLNQVGGQLVEIPLAVICGHEKVSGSALETAWLATPVALEARLDHGRLIDRGLLYLQPDESAAWCSEFNRVFAPQYQLHELGERAFILSGLPHVATPVVDPARLLGAEIGPALPGAEAPELRRLWTEIEMWLHGSALNSERERAGRQRVSALWLWGRDADPRGSRGADERELEIYGGDPLISGLSRMRQPRLRGVPRSLAEVDGSAHHVVAEFAALTGHPQESLPALDVHWFAAARQMLGGGALSLLDIIANDRRFRITPHAGWRFWRRRRSWLENLAH